MVFFKQMILLIFFAFIDFGNQYKVYAVSPISERQKSTQAVRYRLPVTLVEYKKVLVKNSTGEIKHSFRKTPKLQVGLRARIDIANHFYIRNWHIETIPQKWSKKTRKYQVKIRIFRTFGVNKELEESVGYFNISGVVAGDPENLVFIGGGSQIFRDKKNNPLVYLQAGQPPAKAHQRLGRLQPDKSDDR